MAPRLAAALGLALTAALVLPATAATPKAGLFSGQTKQNRAISFKVTPGGGKVKNVEFGFKGTCDNGARTSGTTTFAGKFKIDDGTFRATGGSNSFVKGTFTTRRRAKGRLRWRGTTFDPFTFRTVSCSSPKVRWTAKR